MDSRFQDKDENISKLNQSDFTLKKYNFSKNFKKSGKIFNYFPRLKKANSGFEILYSAINNCETKLNNMLDDNEERFSYL